MESIHLKFLFDHKEVILSISEGGISAKVDLEDGIKDKCLAKFNNCLKCHDLETFLVIWF